MKKVVIGILLIVIIILALFITWYNQNLKQIKEVNSFNNEFEGFLDREITGVDLTTIMNKAIENNNKYEIQKDSKGAYQNNGKNSIEIIVKPTKDGDSYLMEAFELVGMKDFTKNFGAVIFKSTKVEHHENGRISKIVFEVQN